MRLAIRIFLYGILSLVIALWLVRRYPAARG